MGKFGLTAGAVVLFICGVARAQDPIPAAKLLERMQADPYLTRRAAAYAARGRTEPEVRKALLRLARNDSDPAVRRAAISSFGSVSDDLTVPGLLKLARAKGFRGPRGPIWDALGVIGDERAVPDLIDGLERPEGADRAAVALGRMRVVKAFEPLCRLFLTRAAHPDIAEVVPPAILAVEPKKGFDFLLSRFKYHGPTPRRHLVGIMRRGRSERVQAAMLSHLKAHDPDLRQSAIRVLGAAANGKAIPNLAADVRRHPEDLAVTAVALGEIGDPKGAAILSKWLARPKLTTVERIRIARGLATTPDPEGLRPLLEALDREAHPPAKVQLMEALAHLGDARAVANLARLVDDPAFCDQVRRSVTPYRFPYNVHVGAVALWAIRTLVDGTPPIPLADLAVDPKVGEPLPWHISELAGFRTWWKAHAGDEGLRFDGGKD